ncbi:MAG: DUF1178 family protein [Pseudorhodobacter sp.]|nr:DUF1178 family protein [Pseudorhodobacter sp.]
MIRYSLKCAEGHGFESWFQSASAFESLQGAGHVTCPACNSAKVSKVLMAPAIPKKGRSATAPAAPDEAAPTPQTAPGRDRPLSAPSIPQEAALAALRREVERNSEYVGGSFALEARKMHEGMGPGRNIHGEARLEDAKKLIEDGIPIMPLPFLPGRKTN